MEDIGLDSAQAGWDFCTLFNSTCLWCAVLRVSDASLCRSSVISWSQFWTNFLTDRQTDLSFLGKSGREASLKASCTRAQQRHTGFLEALEEQLKKRRKKEAFIPLAFLCCSFKSSRHKLGGFGSRNQSPIPGWWAGVIWHYSFFLHPGMCGPERGQQRH